MGRPDTSDARRAEIIAAAIRVLARSSLAETTTRKIAAEAGINQAMLGYYFGSKDDLLLAVLQEMMRLTAEIVRAVVAPQRHTVRQAIAESIRAFWAHVESSPELQVMQYELTLHALRHPDSAWLAKQQYDGYCAVVENLFEEVYAAANQTSALPFADLARFVVGGLDGMILQFISDHDTRRARHDLEHLIRAVIALAEGTVPQ